MNVNILSTLASRRAGRHSAALVNSRTSLVRLPRQRLGGGFSLIEVMVAMVIGMLGIIVMMQVFAMFESQKRTTTSGDDAISSGAVSLYGIQRVIQQSGWGMSAVQLIGCTVTGLSFAGSANLPLVPVTINSALITGQDVNTDTLLVLSGNGNWTVEGDFILGVAAANYTVHTPTSFARLDRVIAAPRVRPAPCTLDLTTVTGPNPPAIGLPLTLGAAAAFVPGADDLLFNLGNAPTARAYAIRNGNLTMCDYTTANCGAAGNNNNPAVWVLIASNVVSLRAQYGRDTTDAAPVAPATAHMDGAVDVWDQTASWTQNPLAVSANATKNTVQCALLRVAAVRIALVARSSQPEKLNADGTNVTGNAPLWSGSDLVAQGINVANAAAVRIIPPSPDIAWPTWQDFRYKVFQTVIPLRNTTSQGAVSAC